MAAYALIKLINSVETIDNIIVASPEVAATYLVENSGDYDYVIDLTNIDPSPGMGWTYDPGMSAFTAPPVDHEALLEESLYAISTAIEAAVLCYVAADLSERSLASGNVLSALSVSAPEEEITILESIVAFLAVQAGE